jgi:Raf kinase inhibitor-like YbhB/YbcL family protein
MKTTSIIILIILIAIGIYWGTKTKTPMITNVTTATSTGKFSLTSPAFSDGEVIPSQYTCEGVNTNPPFYINNIPEGTKSFALTMYDPDVPTQVLPQGFFDHWVVFNIPVSTNRIEASTTVGTLGNNGSNKPSYTGPCPPSQYEPKEHRYIFTLYALDADLNLATGATREQVESAIENGTSTKLLGKAILTGKYQKTATTSTSQ